MKNKLIYLLLIVMVLLLILMPINYFRNQIYQYFYIHQVAHPLPGNDYDLIVVGSEPEGIAAAVQASKLGLETLLIDCGRHVGGLFTNGGLAVLDMNFDAYGRQIVSNTFFTDFVSKVNYITYKKHDLSSYGFDVNDALTYFDQIITEQENITLILNAKNIKPIINNNLATGIRYSVNNKEIFVTGQIVIDATSDGDIAALSGCPFTFGMEDIGYKDYFQVPTLVFYLGGIDWDRLVNNLPSKMGSVYNQTCTISHDMMRAYQPNDPNIRFRGLNIARQKNNCVAINAMLIFKVNPLDEQSKLNAVARGVVEAGSVTEYIRETIPGFESAYLIGVAKSLYVRETRHIKTEYTLSILDCLVNKDFTDKIALATYPLDLQPRSLDDSPNGQILGNPAIYSIPIRSIVPKAIDNLLIVGRSSGYSSLAHSSARVVAVGMDEGQGAACLAMVSIIEGKPPREVIQDDRLVAYIQKLLNKDGRYLKPFYYPSGITNYLDNKGVLTAIGAGLVQLGYQNDYEVLNRSAENTDFVIKSMGKYILKEKFNGERRLRLSCTDNRTVLKLVLQNAPALEQYSSYEQLRKNEIICRQTYFNIMAHDLMRSQDLYNLCYDIFSYLDKLTSSE